MRLFSAPLLLFAALAGCAHGGLPMPGPLGSLGQDPARAWRSTVDPEQDAPRQDVIRPNRTDGSRRSGSAGYRVAKNAVDLIGQCPLVVDGETYRFDCSGMVEAAYAGAGWSLRGSSADLFELARELGVLHHRRRPAPGDVAFFDDTHDRNGNRRRDDPLTHVALVESVDADGTITLVHNGGKGVRRTVMNLYRPSDRDDESGKRINEYLRSGREDGGPRLTGELWRAFASFWAVSTDAVSELDPADLRLLPREI